ncbi:MAG: radical SAM family heme chaperone HemW [Nitrospirota bacterium]
MVHNLYIHIPFCIRKCAYCDFYSIPLPGASSGEEARSYVDALMREIRLRGNDARGLRTVYLGGGTPSLLRAADIERVLNALDVHYGVDREAEITIEANPGTVTAESLRLFRGAGINRLSIGVQSMDQRELEVLGRRHTAEAGYRAVDAARAAGFDNVSLDLIYGIPGQNRAQWMQTVARIIALEPEHISAYELTPEKNTPLFASLEKGSLVMPGEEEITAMYYDALDAFGAAGYFHYEISNFARPGRQCFHNLNYWNRGTYLGIGAGAHSFAQGRRTANAADVHAYINRLDHDELPVAEETAISESDAFKEWIFLGLRKTEGIDPGEVPGGEALVNDEAAEELLLRGLVELSGHRLRLTRQGLVLSSEVMVRLLKD